MKEIESHSGLLVEYAPDVYCFSHLTFHEFFTALYYYDTKDYAELFNKTMLEPRYMEVFLMCIEKVYNADRYIMQLISHVTNECVEKEEYDQYMHALVQNVLLGSATINHKLRAVLGELAIRLEQLEIDDQSITNVPKPDS